MHFPNLVYSVRGNEVALSVVDGKIIYSDGKIQGIDEREILLEVRKNTDGIGERAAEEFWKVNGTNAGFMIEDKL